MRTLPWEMVTPSKYEVPTDSNTPPLIVSSVPPVIVPFRTSTTVLAPFALIVPPVLVTVVLSSSTPLLVASSSPVLVTPPLPFSVSVVPNGLPAELASTTPCTWSTRVRPPLPMMPSPWIVLLTLVSVTALACCST